MEDQNFAKHTENLAFYKVIDSKILTIGLIVLTLVLYLLWGRKKKKSPPGPYCLPIIGYYPLLRSNPMETVKCLAKKYGNVFGLYLGSQYVVFLADWDAVKEALGQNATNDRRSEAFETIPYKLGVGGVNGQEWVQTRRLSSKVMKDGLQKDNWEDLVQQEVFEMVQLLLNENGKPVDILSLFTENFANNVMSLIMGQRLYVGHPATKMVSQSVDWIMDHSGVFTIDNFSSKLSKLLLMLGVVKNVLGPKLFEFVQFWSDLVDRNKQNMESGSGGALITRFQEEIDSYKKHKKGDYFSDGTVKGTVMAVAIGGSETTRTSFIWLLIAMAENPDKQRKIHEELDREIGKDGSARWSDRYKLPYTIASIMEAQRWRSTAPFPAMRAASEDIQVQGYHIQKGTNIVSCNYLLHIDERYWENPDQFIPERFLLENGKKVNNAPDSWNPFSYGKRNCPGKLLAMMQLLQFFTTVMQKFEVLPKEGDKVQYETHLGLSLQAKNVELRFIPRRY